MKRTARSNEEEITHQSDETWFFWATQEWVNTGEIQYFGSFGWTPIDGFDPDFPVIALIGEDDAPLREG